MDFCTDCQAIHMGVVPCGSRSFRDRLLSVTIDGAALETRTKANYWDKGAADRAFGEDRVDRYWDETGGQGHVERGSDGQLYHTDFKGERKVASDKVLASFVGGEDASDISPADHSTERDLSVV